MATKSEIDYRVGQNNVQILGLDLHNPVFFISAVLIVAFVVVALTFQADTKAFFSWLRPWLTTQFDWLFMLSSNFFVVFCLGLVVSPWGSIRLGGDDARPDYSYAAWLAMLFAAGMGIGLMFFGVLEPVYHFRNPPLGVSAEDVEAARAIGMSATIFHWGLHPWAIYAVVGLSLSFFHYNHDLPLTIRSAFYPLFGDRVWGWLGHVIDTLAVLATLFGLATSLGFGAEQASAGLTHLFGIPATDLTKVLLIAAITSLALISVVAGLDAGVKRLSEINLALALLLLALVTVLGPTTEILSGFFTNTANYLGNLPALSNWIGREDQTFMHEWTTFYWAWWIAWSPFVGMFIARVSKGRTVREFVICVLVVPTLFSIFWMGAFGGTAVTQVVADGYTGVVATVDDWTPELSLYRMLEPLPFASVTSFIALLLVICFFVTSSDSGSLVIDTITAGGKVAPPVAQRVFWAITEGVVAVCLLLGGGLAAMQAAAISTGLPFAIVLLGMCVSLCFGLKAEHRAARQSVDGDERDSLAAPSD